jgi:hypothetical protein
VVSTDQVYILSTSTQFDRFTRIASGPDKNGYHHPYFLRGREDLTHRILRVPRNGNGARGPDTEVPESNFYRMAPITNETVVPLPISSNTNNDDSDTVVTRPAASTVTQQPRQSSTLHQANRPFLDNVLPSRINHVLPDNAIVCLDLASLYLTGRPTTASNPMTRTDSSILDRLLSSPCPLNLSAASAVNPIIQQLHRENARNVISYPSLDDLTMATYILSQQMPERNRMLFHPPQPTIDVTSMINPLVPWTMQYSHYHLLLLIVMHSSWDVGWRDNKIKHQHLHYCSNYGNCKMSLF